MNLENKIVTIQYTNGSAYPPETKVGLIIKQEIAENAYIVKAAYELVFDQLYQPNDPALMSAINEKLTELPEI